MRCRALSNAPYAAAILSGPPRRGTVSGHGYVLIGDDVLALTPPGALRMPNGIETPVRVGAGEEVVVGGGELRTAAATIVLGPTWDPLPAPAFGLSVRPIPTFDVDSLIGWGPGLTPLGDDVAIGYHAAAALRGRRSPLPPAASTTTLGRTLLGLAQDGALPEAAHALLEAGDPEPLARFGHTSGGGIALGLALGGLPPRRATERAFSISLPLGDFEILIGAIPC